MSPSASLEAWESRLRLGFMGDVYTRCSGTQVSSADICYGWARTILSSCHICNAKARLREFLGSMICKLCCLPLPINEGQQTDER